MIILYEDDNVKISGDWNQGYCGEIPESYKGIILPEDYKEFLREHNGGKFNVYFKKSCHHEYELVFFDTGMISNESEIYEYYPYPGWEYSYSQQLEYMEECDSSGTPYFPDNRFHDLPALFDFFYDTHIPIGAFEVINSSAFVIDNKSNYIFVDSMYDDIGECLDKVSFTNPVIFDNNKYYSGYYVPEGIIIPIISNYRKSNAKKYILKNPNEIHELIPLHSKYSKYSYKSWLTWSYDTHECKQKFKTLGELFPMIFKKISSTDVYYFE